MGICTILMSLGFHLYAAEHSEKVEAKRQEANPVRTHRLLKYNSLPYSTDPTVIAQLVAVNPHVDINEFLSPCRITMESVQLELYQPESVFGVVFTDSKTDKSFKEALAINPKTRNSELALQHFARLKQLSLQKQRMASIDSLLENKNHWDLLNAQRKQALANEILNCRGFSYPNKQISESQLRELLYHINVRAHAESDESERLLNQYLKNTYSINLSEEAKNTLQKYSKTPFQLSSPLTPSARYQGAEMHALTAYDLELQIISLRNHAFQIGLEGISQASFQLLLALGGVKSTPRATISGSLTRQGDLMLSTAHHYPHPFDAEDKLYIVAELTKKIIVKERWLKELRAEEAIKRK